LKAKEFGVSAFSVLLVLYTIFSLGLIQVIVFQTVKIVCWLIGFKPFIKTRNFELNQFLDVIIPSSAKIVTLNR
jgi:hypothetical protein